MKRVLFLVLSLSIIGFGRAAGLPHNEPTTLRFPGFELPSGLRIAAVRVDVYGARVSALPKIPEDWGVSLDLEGSFRATVQGECQHGASGLNAGKDIDDMIAVESEDLGQVEVAAVVWVTKDFDTLQTIKLSRVIAVRGAGKTRTETPLKISAHPTVAPFPLNIGKY